MNVAQPTPSPSPFDYSEAFSRNVGWVTETEQAVLRTKRVAIAGLGGVGGVHVTTLARLGIGAFNIADADHFELANFNRQAGATVSSLGQHKLDVMARMARDINPTLDIKEFRDGVNESNIAAFLDGVDIYVDALDFFVLDIRRKIFSECYKRGIPAITAGPIGTGTGYIVFCPPGMSFDDYFQLEGRDADQQRLHFLMGLSPKGPHRSYLADPSRVDFKNGRGPSLGYACMMCAGITAAETMKILLNRGKVYTAPYYQQIDPYTNQWIRGQLRWGNKGPLQRLKIFMTGQFLKRHTAGQAKK